MRSLVETAYKNHHIGIGSLRAGIGNQLSGAAALGKVLSCHDSVVGAGHIADIAPLIDHLNSCRSSSPDSV